jgi:hypothetical protein
VARDREPEAWETSAAGPFLTFERAQGAVELTRKARRLSEQLSDFEPKGATCQAFGVLHEGGFPERALVAIGPDGVVRWSFQADSPAHLPPVELLREGVQALAASPASA